MQLRHGFISSDDHVQEHPEVWTSRMSKAKWGDRIPHVERQSGAREHWVIDGESLGFPAPAFEDVNGGDGGRRPERWDDVSPAVYDPRDRLAVLDAARIDCSVLYPTVAGVAAEIFGRLADSDLELACAQAYNDWLIEEWISASDRYIPQCIAPIWPIKQTVEEIKRAAANGHKGVIFPASPMELRNVPHINEPAYDPLWNVCQELSIPICFHSGASPRIRMAPGAGFSPALADAFRNIVRSVSSVAVLANFLFSRVLSRFPNLKVVFAESSLGWGAYELEYADYQSEADGLHSEGYELKPSELFQRHCYFTCFYDRVGLRVRRYVGVSNILWSAHFPLSTSQPQESRRQIDISFSDMSETEKDRILWQNAAELYSIDCERSKG